MAKKPDAPKPAKDDSPTFGFAEEPGELPLHHDLRLMVEEWWSSGNTTGEIIAKTMAQFGVSESTAYRRWGEVRDDMAKVREESRPYRKAQIRMHLMRAISAGHRFEQIGAVVSAIKELKALDGLDEPQEIRDVSEPEEDMSNLTDEEINQYIELADKARRRKPS